MSPWTGWLRKGMTLATVTRRHRSTPSLTEYADRVRKLSSEAARAASPRQQIWILWRIEGLTFACADRGGRAFRLSGVPLPPEAGPPAACGLSMAAVLEVGFEPAALADLFAERTDPRFVDFAFESTGLMLAAYEGDLFGRLTAGLGRLGLMRRYRLSPPDPASFLAALSPEQRLYAAHGFGRLLYFKRHDLAAVLRSLERRSYLPFAAAVKGAIAAYVLVNGASLSRILALADQDLDAELAAAIHGGLHNVVKLLAWSLPNSLDGVTAPGPRGAALLASAVEEAAVRRARGTGPGLEA